MCEGRVWRVRVHLPRRMLCARRCVISSNIENRKISHTSLSALWRPQSTRAALDTARLVAACARAERTLVRCAHRRCCRSSSSGAVLRPPRRIFGGARRPLPARRAALELWPRIRCVRIFAGAARSMPHYTLRRNRRVRACGLGPPRFGYNNVARTPLAAAAATG